MRIYVVGVGNSWASDDAIGPKVVRQLQAQFGETLADQTISQNGRVTSQPGARAQVVFQTLSHPAVELLDLKEQCDVLLVVDAVASGAPPGTIHRELWQTGVLSSKGVERASTHGLGVHELLELAAKLDQLPGQVILVGIEINSTKPGHGLSPDVAAALPALVERLRREVKAYLQ